MCYFIYIIIKINILIMHAYLETIHLYNDNSDYSIQTAAVNYVVFECEIVCRNGRLFVRTSFWERKETKSMPQRR